MPNQLFPARMLKNNIKDNCKQSRNKFDNSVLTWNKIENIFKIFNPDGSHIEVPVGAYIIKAPDGYNKITSDIIVQSTEDLSLIIEVPNSTGTLLPSTGGIGTTIFYFAGAGLIIGSAIALNKRKK